MLSNCNGKIRIYASDLAANRSQLEIVGSAARKVAEHLHLNLEIVRFKNSSTKIHVYYKGMNEEEIPLYSAKKEMLDEEEVYTTLRNMIFVLSFHPKYPGLKKIRREVMKLS